MNPPRLYRHRKPEERLNHHLTVSLNDEDEAILARVARATGRTKTEAIRLAIREYFNSMREAMKCER